MALLQHAQPPLEKRVLENAKKFLPDVSELKVYLMLQPNGTFIKNSNGQVAMTLLTDAELDQQIRNGEVILKENLK